MDTAHVRRFTAISGFLAFVLYVASVVLIFDIPTIDAPTSSLASYVGTHQARLFAEAIIWGFATVATVCFISGLWSLLRDAVPNARMLAMLALGAGLLTYALVQGNFVFTLALAFRPHGYSPDITQLLYDLTLLGVTLAGLPTALSTVAFSLLMLRSSLVPNWVAWLGFLVAMLHVVAAVSFASGGWFSPSGIGVFVSPPLYYLWILAASAFLLGRAKFAQG
jgi:Domain of unknown function (DUF4386)